MVHESQRPAERAVSPGAGRRRTRRWIRWLGLLLLLPPALYLLAANLFLLPSVGPSLISRRPERFRLAWQSAWSLWPGEVRFQGLEIRGHQPRVRWWITAEQGTASIDLPALLRREVRIESLHAAGVRSQTDRLAPPSEPPQPRPARRREPWTVRLEAIELSRVRELGYGPLRLQGEGRIAGSFRIVMRREVEVGPAVLAMPAGRLLVREREVAREVDLRAELRLGPYSPREHRGAAGFDFLTGRLTADGEVPELPVLAKIGRAEAVPVPPGRLSVDLRVEGGRLVEGSRVELVGQGGGLEIGGCVGRAAGAVPSPPDPLSPPPTPPPPARGAPPPPPPSTGGGCPAAGWVCVGVGEGARG